MSELQRVIQNFTMQLTALVEDQALTQARAAAFVALGGSERVAGRRGRPPKAKPVQITTAKAPTMRPRRKAPKQFCPVPGCKNLAAPAFGMVCAKHNGVAKSKIRKYREERRARKLGLKVPSKASKRGPKKARRQKSVVVSQAAPAPAAA